MDEPKGKWEVLFKGDLIEVRGLGNFALINDLQQPVYYPAQTIMVMLNKKKNKQVSQCTASVGGEKD